MPKLCVLITFENKNCKQIQKTFSLSKKEKKLCALLSRCHRSGSGGSCSLLECRRVSSVVCVDYGGGEFSDMFPLSSAFSQFSCLLGRGEL
ncbi:BnaC02g17550D [Brassica napus]|uniref:BnaC02g17550D protein n=1 Tax=Brassica napus TaxID=3708 RepID=A0A078H548_BRANA|nr:BnaC02g17550D [Brassica napus]